MALSAEQETLWGRFAGFLAKIDERQKEIYAEAADGVREIIDAYPEDPMPLGNALQGLRFRLAELRTKVEDTWSKQIEDKFRAADTGGFWDRGLDHKTDFLQSLEEAWNVFEVKMNGEFYRKLKPRAEALMQKEVPCVGCGGSLPMPVRHVSVSVKCPFCNAVNQVLPEGAIAMFYVGGPLALAQEAALSLRHAVERFRIQAYRARRSPNGWRNEPIESFDRWEAMERAYWQTYIDTAAAASGLPADQALLDSRMQSFRDQELMRDQRWRKAKGL